MHDKPRVVSTKLHEELTLDTSVGWFEGDAFWGKSIIRVSLDADGDCLAEGTTETAESLWMNQSKWNSEIAKGILDELLDLKNDCWLEEGESEIDAGTFMAAISLTSINVLPNGEFNFWYDDSDLFWGHAILVAGSLSDGINDVGIQG